LTISLENHIDLARYLASQPVPFQRPDMSTQQLAIARALIALHETYYTGSTDPATDRRQQMLRVLGIPK
jgi:hypothetical protein